MVRIGKIVFLTLLIAVPAAAQPPRTGDKAEMVLGPAGEFWMGSGDLATEVSSTSAPAITAATTTSESRTKNPSQSKPSKSEWIIILKAEGNIKKADKEKCVQAIKDKWLANKSYDEITVEEFNENLANYEGKKVLRADLVYFYGEYEFSVRSAKVKKDGGKVIVEPLEEGPVGRFRGKDSIDQVLKEIQFMK